MTTYEIIAQALGIIAMALIILSFQAKKQKALILTHFFGCAFFVANFFYDRCHHRCIPEHYRRCESSYLFKQRQF